MRRRPLLWTTGAMTAATLGCMAPPTTYGLRSAGDATPRGEVGVGASAALSTGFSGAGATADFGVSDTVAVAGGLGTLAGGFQAELEARFGTPRERAAGLGFGVGASGLAYNGAFFAGPMVSATGRTALGPGSLYGGLKASWTLPVSGGAVLFQDTVWWGPVAGYASKPARVRWGVELVPLVGDLSAVTVGAQGWVRFAPGTD